MGFMSRRKTQGRVVVVILALIIGVTMVGSSIYYSFSGTGISGNQQNTAGNSKLQEDQIIQNIKILQDQVKNNPSDLKTAESLASFGYFELGKFYMQKASTATDKKVSDDLLKKADEQYNLAIVEYEKVIKADPKNVASLGDLATSYFYINRVDDAIITAQKALAVDPNYNTARMNLGIYLGEGKQDYKGAIVELKKIPSSDQNYQNAKDLIDKFSKATPTLPNLPQSNTPAKK